MLGSSNAPGCRTPTAPVPQEALWVILIDLHLGGGCSPPHIEPHALSLLLLKLLNLSLPPNLCLCIPTKARSLLEVRT